MVGLPLERILVGEHPESPPPRLDETPGDEGGPFFDVELRFAGRTLVLAPQDVETPTALHQYADVDRVRIVLDTDPPPEPPDNQEELDEFDREAGAVEPVMFEVAADLGEVRDVHLLATLAWFTPPEPSGPVLVGDVEIGGDGIGYAVEYAHPGDAETLAMLDAADGAGIDTGLVEFDVGIRFELDAGRSLTVSTSGWALYFALDGPLPEDLRDVVELVPVRDRLAPH